MRTRNQLLVCAFTLPFIGCGDDAPAFLALDQLCDAIAEDICNAPSGCCKVINDEAECVTRVKNECEAERQDLVKEDRLSYDGVKAAERRRAGQDALASCDAAFAIASFFEGGLEMGMACDRDAECATGACDSECVEGSGPALCNDRSTP